jgi:hypothetical protein
MQVAQREPQLEEASQEPPNFTRRNKPKHKPYF